MPIFKYIVVNNESKKLSGTVEAPNETIAKTELNNLGFSVISIQVTDKISPSNNKLTRYVFEAVDKKSKLINGTIPAKTKEEAFLKLHKEYNLTVTAIWLEGASDEQIKEAKMLGTNKLRQQLHLDHTEAEEQTIKSIQDQKEEAFTKNKIEIILKQINDFLPKFSEDIEPQKKAEINKRIDKLLRIKNSTNLQYILETARDLLEFIKEQEQTLSEQGHNEKRLELQIQTQQLLNKLQQGIKKKTLSEDILEKIEKWQKRNLKSEEDSSKVNSFISTFLNKLKKFFQTPAEIQAIKEQIKAYNRQLYEFALLYFKEPTKEYKEKVKNAIKTTWKARKKAKHTLKHIKKILKSRAEAKRAALNPGENLQSESSILDEVNAFTGWLLFFYIIYYFISLYINTKNFGFTEIPPGLQIYQSNIFKYALILIFLLHSSTAIKLNFFRNNKVASVIIFPLFLLTSIISLLNF